MKRARESPLTLQGICLETLAGNLPDTDIEAIQKAFKKEVLKRAKTKTIERVTAALPTWATLAGFRVSVHAISGGLNSIRIDADTGVGYASFGVKHNSVMFNAEAKKILKRLKPERWNQSYNSHQYNVDTPTYTSTMRSVLAELVPKDTDSLAMANELWALVKNK